MQQSRKGRPLYRPLNGGEIRLIEIYPGDWNDPIACQLHYVPLVGNTSLDYVALSYAWGDQSTPKTEVCVNGRERQITRSLYTALRQLRSFGTTGDEAEPAVRFELASALVIRQCGCACPALRHLRRRGRTHLVGKMVVRFELAVGRRQGSPASADLGSSPLLPSSPALAF